MIPFAIGEVVSAEGNYVPVIVGAVGYDTLRSKIAELRSN